MVNLDDKAVKAIIAVIILGIIIYIIMKMMSNKEAKESYSDSFWRKVNPTAESFSDSQWRKEKSAAISQAAKEGYETGGDEVLNWQRFATKKLTKEKYDPEWQTQYLIKKIPGYQSYQSKYRK